MEKYVIFGPIIIFFGLFVLLVLGFFILALKLIMQGKNAAWKGRIIDKSHVERNKDESKRREHLYSARVLLDNGEAHDIPLTAELFGKWEIGDTLEKKKGTLWPAKVQ